MGAEQSKRIEEISSKPPAHLEEANKLFLSFYGDAIEKMSFIQHQETREFYIQSANDNNSHPGHEMACDLSNIGHFMAHSGVMFTDKRKCGVIHPNATTTCNGTSSSGKTQAMTAANVRVSAVSSKIIADHSALPDQDEDIEMTPYVSIQTLNTDKEEKFDVSYSRRAFHDYVIDFKNNNNSMTSNTLWDSNCDRLKAFYIRIMKKHGHARFVIYELSDKISSLKEAGDDSAANFFIQASDKVIPGRGYSTAKCSTPELSGAAVTVLTGKKMMESVATTADSLVWSPFILDSQCCADALNLVDMNDSYLFLLAMTKTGSNKTTSSSTPDHQVARIEFKSFIISKLLSLTSAQDNFRTSSSILTTKLYQAKWKPLNNMQYIESLMDDLEDCGAVKLTDPEDKKKKNRKYCKIITRNKLSSLDDAQIAKAKKLFTKLDVPIRRWSCQWGSNEIATAAQKFK
eukprot:908272_1